MLSRNSDFEQACREFDANLRDVSIGLYRVSDGFSVHQRVGGTNNAKACKDKCMVVN